jgi:HAD superfamily hydrolase (TIGR01549 family)
MRAILFDFGGTLDSPRHWLDRFLAYYRAAGYQLSRSELDRAFDAATRIAYRSAAQLREYRLGELIPYLVGLQLVFLRDQDGVSATRSKIDLNDPAVVRSLTDRISGSFIRESQAGLAHSRTVLAALAGRFRLGVVSNFYGNLDYILKEAGFDGIISTIADSGRLGIYKPDLRIYEAALSAMGVDAREALMVGDSLDKDCAPARRLGMRTAWLRHREALSPEDLLPADFTISALDELKDVICRIG